MKNMLIVTGGWNGQSTFKLIPTTLDAPFAEAIYRPDYKSLSVISKMEHDAFKLLPRLSEDGNVIPVKKAKKNGVEVQEERKHFRTLYEYQIIVKEEIVAFIEMFSINPEYPYKALLETPVEEQVEA